MSDIDLTQFSANFLPVLDASGKLQNAPLERVSGSFYAVGVDGYEFTSQITLLRIYGLDPVEGNHGYLSALIDSVSQRLEIFRVPDPISSSTGDRIAYVDLSSYVDNDVMTLIGDETYHPQVCGEVQLSYFESDYIIRLYVPMSTTTPIVLADTAYFISDMELHGVTNGFSQNGVLTCNMTVNEGLGAFAFTLSDDVAGAVATGSGPLDAYAPYTCELVPVNGSGISGHVILEGFANMDGTVVIKVVDGVRIPTLAGTGIRALAVDANGVIVLDQ